MARLRGTGTVMAGLRRTSHSPGPARCTPDIAPTALDLEDGIALLDELTVAPDRLSHIRIGLRHPTRDIPGAAARAGRGPQVAVVADPDRAR